MTTTHLTPAELDALLEVAKAATPGPYEARLGSGNNVCTALASVAPDSFDDFVCDVLPDYACKPGIATRWEANRNFIEQANPATIERLVLMVRELRQVVVDTADFGDYEQSVTAKEKLRAIKNSAVEHFRARAVRAIQQLYEVPTPHNIDISLGYAEGLERATKLIESLPLVETEE